MEPILVPAPPPSSFNKNRPPSDLLMSQLKHFQHLEQKHLLNIDAGTVRDIHTEAGAARYITAITRTLRSKNAATSGLTLVPSVAPGRKKVQQLSRSSDSLSIAASAAPATGEIAPGKIAPFDKAKKNKSNKP